MHVIATAGHVDHGKSTLLRALTGADPDRLDEERRRGLTIELGYVWTRLPDGGDVAFVDVPGHERFLRTMLAGVGPVPAVLLVVAADDPWMPQTTEHLAALSALGVRHGVVAVSRADLADPAPMAARAARELAATSLAGAPVVPVSGTTGAGLDQLREALASTVAAVPAPDATADVRLWLDRSFHVRGAGAVVTGTLGAGTVRVGDRLATGSGTVRVRGLESLGSPAGSTSGVSRVALNVVGDVPGRGGVLVTPDAWHFTATVDAQLGQLAHGEGDPVPPTRSTVHVGATAVPARVRPLADRTVRLALDGELPLRVGDRLLVRDPGSRRLWGARVLDPAPPRLRRRGAARHRAQALAPVLDGSSDVASEVERRGVAPVGLLRRIGVPGAAEHPEGWLVGDRAGELLRARMREVVRHHDEEHPLDPGLPVPAVARALGLPSPELVPGLVPPPLRLEAGRVWSTSARPGLPEALERSLARLGEELVETPFAAPTADRLVELGLDRKAVAAAARADRLLHLGDGIVLLPGADRIAAARLADLDQPFTTSSARQLLDTTRRVVLPLLAHLDRTGATIRHPDDRRSLR